MNIRNLEIVRRTVQLIAVMATVGLSIGGYVSCAPIDYIEYVEVIGSVTMTRTVPIFNFIPSIICIISLAGILTFNGSVKRYFKRRDREEREFSRQQQELNQIKEVASRMSVQENQSSHSQVQAIMHKVKFCMACGQKINDIAQYCEFCGTPQ